MSRTVSKAIKYKGITMLLTSRGVVFKLQDLLHIFKIDEIRARQFISNCDDEDYGQEVLAVDVDNLFNLAESVSTDETELFGDLFTDRILFGMAVINLVDPDHKWLRLCDQEQFDSLVACSERWLSFIRTVQSCETKPIPPLTGMVRQLYADKYGKAMPSGYLDCVPDCDLDIIRLAASVC
jgi:hypothetical protein